MGALNLPQELLDLVFGDLRLEDRIERRTIADCGLVCKSWLPSSRYRLFADVALNDRTLKRFFTLMETSPFPLPTFIRSLGLSSAALDESPKLGPLPQVTTLRIKAQRTVFAPDSTLQANSFANLSTLSLNGCRISLGSFLSAISSFPALKSLELRWVALSYDDLLSVYQFPPQCRTLILFMFRRDADQFFQALLTLHTIPVFSSLSVTGWAPSVLGTYLRHVGDDLKFLQLGFDNSSLLGAPPSPPASDSSNSHACQSSTLPPKVSDIAVASDNWTWCPTTHQTSRARFAESCPTSLRTT